MSPRDDIARCLSAAIDRGNRGGEPDGEEGARAWSGDGGAGGGNVGRGWNCKDYGPMFMHLC